MNKLFEVYEELLDNKNVQKISLTNTSREWKSSEGKWLSQDCYEIEAECLTGSIIFTVFEDCVLMSGYFSPVNKIPDDFKIWKGIGYMGGHTSQSHWDTDQEFEKMGELILKGYSGINRTYTGNCSGYYPEIKYWK